MDGAPELVHGTAIAIRRGASWRAALIRGASGSGKSDLALRCLATPPSRLLGAEIALVADDQVLMQRRDRTLEVSCPPTLRGKLEVRGIGIIEIDSIDIAELELVVDLAAHAEIPRLPDPPLQSTIHGLVRPWMKIAAFDASAPLKLLLALGDPAVLAAAHRA